MRILITGGAGHIGSKLAQWALETQGEIEVVVCDDLSCGYRENVPAGAQMIQCDAGDPALINDHGPFDAVFHLAAYAAECMSPFVRRFNYQNNLVTTAGLVSNLIAADFTGQLVYASSIAVYGHKLKAPFYEDMPCEPGDPYGIAKLAGEQDIRVAGEQHGLRWCVVRPHNVYGPGQSLWQKYRNVIGLWMRAILEGGTIVVFGDGEQRRSFTYIDDVMEPLWRCAMWDAPEGHVINLGGSSTLSINELLDVVLDICDAKGRQVHIDRRPARHEARNAWTSSTKAHKLLEAQDLTGIYQGVCKMWDWAQVAWRQFPERRTHPVRPTIDDVELFDKMPQSWAEELGAAAPVVPAGPGSAA